MGASACASKPSAGPTEPAAGCYDSTTSALSFIYDGQLATYKNIQVATNVTECGSQTTVEFLTLVLAPSQAAALTECQLGADPGADTAINLNALGVDGMPANAWMCGNPLSGELLQAGDCHAVGTASVQYDGPRNSADNAEIYSGTTCIAASASKFTWVQHSSEAAATGVCASIDPIFDGSSNLAALFPTAPNDTYVCTTA